MDVSCLTKNLTCGKAAIDPTWVKGQVHARIIRKGIEINFWYNNVKESMLQPHLEYCVQFCMPHQKEPEKVQQRSGVACLKRKIKETL